MGRINLYQHAAGPGAETPLVQALAPPFDDYPNLGKSQLDKLPHRMRLAGRQHVVAWLWLLQNDPHPFDEIARVSPIAFRVQVSQVQAVLLGKCNGGDRTGYLARYKGFSPTRTFVVEENPIRGVKAVGLTIVDGDPVGVELRYGVRTARVEGRGLVLGDRPHLAIQFARRGLVESGFVVKF